MNYIAEINAFYDWLETNSVTDSCIVLWHALMHICNKAGWIPEFAVAISTLEVKTGLKKDAINRARHRLQQAGRIDFKSRTGQLSAVYTIIPFVSQKTTQTESEIDCDVLSDANRVTNRAQSASQTASQPASQTASQSALEINKHEDRGANLTHGVVHDNSQSPPLSIDLNNNIDLKDQDRKRESRAFALPSFQQVAEYCAERKNSVDPQRFIDFYTAKNWFIGKNKMKDWRAAVRTWDNRNKEGGMSGGANQATLKFPPASESGKSPYDAMFDR
jgi:hypothetical protein